MKKNVTKDYVVVDDEFGRLLSSLASSRESPTRKRNQVGIENYGYL